MLEIYKNIKKLRQEQGLTQIDLAKRCGYDSGEASYIDQVESGDVDIFLSEVESFAKALKVSPSTLMGDSWQANV